jgi:enterochelin esterase-like enzyme
LCPLGAILWTIIFWHKLAIHNFRNIFIRISAIIVIQILLVGSIAIEVNRSDNFYASWGDLFGSKNELSKIAISPTSLAAITADDVKSARRTPNGSLIFKKIITGATSKVSDRVYVVVSPSISKIFESSPSPQLPKNYQVVELFSGYPGVPETWIGTLHGIETMEKMELAGEIPPTIAIIPSINVVRRVDTECLNIPGVAQVETWLTADMKTFAQKFIGIDNRKWTTFGFSTGGWCAAALAIRNTDQYQQAISLAGYFSPIFSAGISKNQRKAMIHEYNLEKTIKSQINNPDLLIIYSKNDITSYESMKKFIKAVGGSLPIKVIEIPHGGHNIKVWRPYVRSGFKWLANLGEVKFSYSN